MIPEVHRASPDRRFVNFKAPSGRVWVILEVEKEVEDLFIGVIDRQSAWDVARSQTLPVVFVSKSGRQQSLGRVFSPMAYERTVHKWLHHTGWTGMDFETWLPYFRTNPEDCRGGLDEFMTESLAYYKRLLGIANVA